MADHSSIQQRLNSDIEFRKKFMNDPAGVLREAGAVVTPEKEKMLHDFVRQAGAAAGTAADHKININGGISIGIRF